MRNLKLVIEYDGTDFVGWQSQSNGPSIQEEIEKAFRSLTQEDARLVGAGRTDAGVHARGQVANIRLATKLESSELLRGLNALLPESIVVHAVKDVSADFHARYSAVSRSYRYLIHRSKTAIDRHMGWYVGCSLDVDAMQRCAAIIMGDHDFRAFCRSIPDADHYQCRVISSSWTPVENRLYYDVTANRFLHGMVRALVGTMVDVGRGFRQTDEFKTILESRDRSMAGMSAPAKGLCLERIEYDGER
ncbi:MAG: tRNA pseudouridine(38-40) synthase TruA [Ignavibacteria bacterium]|nr:tRNA pseudouridine(38-40) synthase TruA [Ignavibacteria bacterium]